MPLVDLLAMGGELLLLGMGIVFSFLILLVLAVKVMSWMSQRIHREESSVSEPPAARPVGVDRALIAVVSAAVARYRAEHRN